MIPTRRCCAWAAPTALAVVIVTAGSAACGRNDPGPAEDAGVIAVTTVAARLTTLRDNLTVGGTVTPPAAADFVVMAPEPAQIAELPKNEGDAVQAGEVVLRLDVPSIMTEIATRQLELAEVTLRVDRARSESDRLGGLYEKGLAARNQWEAARAVLSAAETEMRSVRGRLDVAKSLEASTIVRARFSGIVAKRWHNVGDQVLGGDADPILRIVDSARLQVSALVPLQDATRVLSGQNAVVQTGVASEAGIVAIKITPASPVATVVDIRVNFLAPTTLPIDSAVQVDIALDERRDVIAVPADAIQRAEGATFVWMASDNNQATRRDVRVGLIVGNLAQIVSGLNVGEQVIVTGIAQLAEGTPVTIGK